MEKDPCRGAVCILVLCDHPSLVSVLLPFCYSYILLHYKCVLLLLFVVYGILHVSIRSRNNPHSYHSKSLLLL